MGLDMYLTAKRYAGEYSDPTLHAELNEVLRSMDLPEEIIAREITVEAMYWRKANAIHRWFVQNVQNGEDDCGEYPVSREKLAELFELLEQVLEDRSLANELLPPQEGFFFGGTDIDEWYWKYLQDTRNRLAVLLDENCMSHSWEFYYQSSW